MKKKIIVVMITLLGVSFVGISSVVAEDCQGTGTPGYWKNHPAAWNGESIEIGNEIYTPFEAIQIMNMPVKGDKSLTLFNATVAATLNVTQQNCDPPPDECPPITKCWKNTELCAPLDQANAWLATYGVISVVGASTDEWQYSHGEDIYWCLDAYNNGLRNEPARD